MKEKKTHVVYSFTYLCVYLSICLSNTYLLYELSYQTLSDSLSSLNISVPFLLQSCPEGDVCCWCPYFGQQCAGLRGHHNKVC